MNRDVHIRQVIDSIAHIETKNTIPPFFGGYFFGYYKYKMEDKSKTGPKPKQLTEGTIIGLPVGRDKKVVPPDQVQELAALGCRDTEISNFFGVAETTLRYNFSAQLTKGREELKITLRRAMLKNAITNQHAAVQIFLAKNILGMSDTPIGAESNAPLPWNEYDDQDVELLEEAVAQAQEDQESSD